MVQTAESNYLSLVFDSDLGNLEDINDSFARGVLKVAYIGKNRNGSFISKEAFERSIHTIYNCPIVCNYDRDEDELGGHDMEVVINSEGDINLVNITQPVGVIPESAKYWWATVEDDGGEHEYLHVEAILWKRQEAFRKIFENNITKQSMEIAVKEGAFDESTFKIYSFEFLAFCLLGNCEPCFEGASLQLFERDNFKAQYLQMLNELKQGINQLETPQVGDTGNIVCSKGGEEVLEQKVALVAEFGLTEEQIDFNLEEFELDELRVKFEELAAAAKATAFALSEQVRASLVEALHAEKTTTEFGEMPRYIYIDHDADKSEVYCWDAAEDWKMYGFCYSANGDDITIDFACKKRKKYAIVDYIEGEQAFAANSVFELLKTNFAEANTEWEQKYQATSETISALQGELEALKQYKAEVETAALAEEKNGVFAQFEELTGNEAFEALKADSENYSVEEIEEKCYAIYGRSKSLAKFSGGQGTPRLPIDRQKKSQDEPYGGLFVEFPPRA